MTRHEADLLIIGGGAAGLLAAITATEAAAASGTPCRCLLVERLDRCGQKIRATGNGRANVGAVTHGPSFYVTGSSPTRMARLVQAADIPAAMRALTSAGIPLTDVDGRLYPRSFEARQVAELLEDAARAGGTEILTGYTWTELIRRDGAYMARFRPTAKRDGAGSDGDAMTITASAVILAAGGASQPALGADGRWTGPLKNLDIPIHPLQSSLQALEVLRPFRRWRGVRQEALATLWRRDPEQGKGGWYPLGADRGEVQFTAEGLSGVVIMQLSLLVPYALTDPHVSCDVTIEGGAYLRDRVPSADTVRDVSKWLHRVLTPLYGRESAKATHAMTLDLCPDTSSDELLSWLYLRRDRHPYLTGTRMTEGLLPTKLSEVLSTMCGKISRAPDREDAVLRATARLLKGMPFALAPQTPSPHAQVSRGGIALEAVDPETLEIHGAPGLYAAGEMLDVAGLCGGHNLGFAFGTGRTAARSALESLQRR